MRLVYKECAFSTRGKCIKEGKEIFYFIHCVVTQLNNNCASLMTEQNVKLTFCATKGKKSGVRYCARARVCVKLVQKTRSKSRKEISGRGKKSIDPSNLELISLDIC